MFLRARDITLAFSFFGMTILVPLRIRLLMAQNLCIGDNICRLVDLMVSIITFRDLEESTSLTSWIIF